VVSNTAGTVTSAAAILTVNADATAPSIPVGLTATAVSSSQVNLSWTASTDNVGVTGYNVFRNGGKIATSSTTSFTDSSLAASTSYTYNVSAFDGAGNTSGQSSGAAATTLGAGGSGQIPATLGWFQIPNTSIQSLCPPYTEIQGSTGCKAVMSAWSGGLFDTKRNRLVIHGGGHTDYYGNEIYAIDLNANPIAPVLVKDASHGSAITNLSTCPETFLDGTPNARHIYNGELYLPNQDAYFLYGAFKSICGNSTDGQWQYSPVSGNWTQQTPSTHPNQAQNGSVPQFAYDPTSGNIYEVEDNTGIFWQYNIGGNTWTNLASVSGCGVLNMTTAIDNGRRLYFCVGNGGFNKVSLNAPYTATQLTGTGCSAIIGASGPGFVYDPVQKLMVGWAGGNTAYIYNPDTDSCSTATYSGGPTTIQGNGTYGRFAYSPALGVFVVANSIDTNVYSLRLTAGGGTGGSGSGPNISNVSASAITTSGANITWVTDVAASSQVEYGTTTNYGTLSTLNATLVTSHSVSLTGLSANTLYHYRVHSKNSSGTESISGDFVLQTSNTTDTQPPSITITAPANGLTVSGSITVTATATDNVGVAGVQFFLDGSALGTKITASPYQVAWNTSTTSNAAHILTAQASDAAGNIGNAISVTVTVSNSGGGGTAQQDFQNRCNAGGVIVCDNLNSSAGLPQRSCSGSTSTLSGLFLDCFDSTSVYGTVDTTTYTSGGGSLLFTIPGTAGSDPAGYYRRLFASSQDTLPSGATVFGQNSDFYFQYRQRMDTAYLTNVWPANGGGETYWKQFIMSNDSATCSQEDLVVVNDVNEGYPLAYSQCGALPFQRTVNSVLYNEFTQNLLTGSGPSGYNCAYGSAQPNANCFNYPANTWVTYYFHVHVGTWGSANSLVEGWVATPSAPTYKQWLYMNNLTYFQDAGSPGFDMITLLAYWTNRNGNVSAGPVSHTWYNELIVSTQPIAAPQAAPAAP
jgi:hypothetical protein